MAAKAGAADRSVPARRRHRQHRPHHGRLARDAARAAGHRREQARRERRDRRGIRRALGVNDRLPPKSLAEFVDYVKARPGQLNFASPGAGTVGHLTMALFLARAGLRMEAVLYKGGGPAMVDVLSGQVPVYFGNLNELIPHLASGRIRVLAVSGGKRASQLPDVQTVAEQGYPGFRTETWNGVAAPAGTAQEIVERLAR